MTKPKTLGGAITSLSRAVKIAAVLADSAEAVQVAPEHIAAVQDAIAAARDLERSLAIRLGQGVGTTQGELADGRLFYLKRAQDRAAWDHDDWKRDVRRRITEAATRRFRTLDDAEPMLADVITGEAVTLAQMLQTVLAEAQAVHGSTAPKSTALKALGLYAGDYCETSPGGWTFRATPKSTTIQEN